MEAKFIDINVDVGEGIGNESILMPIISSCNIACGGHAGNSSTMQKVVKLAKQHRVKIGAHPSFPDVENFGRKPMNMPCVALFASIKEQINELIKKLNDFPSLPTVVSKVLDITSNDVDRKKPFLFFESYSWDDCISKHKPNIMLVPGASFESKMYPLVKYAKICNKINGNFIILWGSPSERLIAEKIKLLSPEVFIVNKLSLDKLKALISRLRR